ncbi:MAG: bifunctional DNA-formamidopyrimidine glycosylase/DNA-(apurinic or apyrimidinic site) lyase [Candidatus Obscuribacterales bacterium]|nr:bifunctional DNA-formamidopyrimidine glycosylase/DNA-(apurinic or apyrimidinic site) lyase [Candidatus Obscuribacterales bacterium]
MPELPEVECVLRGLEKSLAGERIESVKVLREQSIACPSAKSFAKLVPGRVFSDFVRRGKYLLMSFDDGSGLACHLRMSGALVVKTKKSNKDKNDKHLRVLFKMQSGKELHFEDMRVFGRLWFVKSNAKFEEVIPALSKMGPEPLTDLTHNYLQEKLATRSQSIKAALLDQGLIAGIGNIYADEVLFLTGVHPQTRASDLSAAKLKKLVENIRLVLTQAIVAGGSSIRDYKDSFGVNGNYQNEALVYGRVGLSCTKCGSKIERVKLAGRSAHFCSRCQRR